MLNQLIYILSSRIDKSSPIRWAKKEIDLTCQNASDYYTLCCKNALKLFKIFANKGHTGFSANVTMDILNRLVKGKSLTAINDTPDIWVEIFDDGLDCKMYQCNRAHSLFKKIYDEKTIYTDVDRHICVDSITGETYHYGFVVSILDELFPIEFPYYQREEPMMVYINDNVGSKENDEFITINYIMDGNKRIEVNQTFKIQNEKWMKVNKESD